MLLMVRPERFELPAFWFVAVAARDLNNLHRMSRRRLELHQQGVTKTSAAILPISPTPSGLVLGTKMGTVFMATKMTQVEGRNYPGCF